MSEFKIIGNPTPVVGEKEFYTISQPLPTSIPITPLNRSVPNPFEKPIEWSVYVLELGKWIKKEENNKKGDIVPFTFLQKSLDRDGIIIVAERGMYSSRLDIKPHKAESPKIHSIEFLDYLGNKPTKPFAYGQTLKARIQCLHMERRTVYATLWEDDAAGAGHNKANEKNKMMTLPGTVKEGIADIDFFLAPDFAKIANARKAKGDSSEGKTHEYYVTVEFFNKKTASANTNVANPSYSDTTAKPAPLKKQTPAQKKGPSKKQEKEKSIGEDIIDWIEDTLKIEPIILPDPLEIINSVVKIFQPEGEEDDKKGVCVCKEYAFHWGKDLTCDERKKVLQVCSNLWGEEKKKEKASELMSIMHIETGGESERGKKLFKPYADNGAGYSGLIQFSDATAKSLGKTREQLKAMTFIQQMDYVQQYLSKKKNQLTTMTDLYLMVLKPNAVGQGSNPNFILFDESISVPDVPYDKDNLGKEPWVTKYGYASNPSYIMEIGEFENKRQFQTYSKGIKEKRGFPGGKTSVWEVTEVLNKRHYDLGKTKIFNEKCESVKNEEKNEEKEQRAPWLKVAWEEFNKYKGKTEVESPLKERIAEYFKLSGNADLNHTNAWCATFIFWCFQHTKKFKDTNVNGNVGAFDWAEENNSKIIGNPSKDGWVSGEKTDVFVGAIVVFSFSHVAIIVGENNDGSQYVYLGGNQGSNRTGGQKICLGSISKTSNQIFMIMKPKNYSPNEEEKKLPKYDVNSENSGASSR